MHVVDVVGEAGGVLDAPGAEGGVASDPLVQVVHALSVPGEVEHPAGGGLGEALNETIEDADASILDDGVDGVLERGGHGRGNAQLPLLLLLFFSHVFRRHFVSVFCSSQENIFKRLRFFMLSLSGSC